MDNSAISVFWFRRDLRLHDNKGLYEALKSGDPVLPIFIFDANILSKLNETADPRVNFIYDRVCWMKKELEKHNATLKIFHGDPQSVFQSLIQEYPVAAVYTNRDYEPYAKRRDADVSKLLFENGIAFNTFKDHVIFESLEIATDEGQPYKVYTPYKNKWLVSFNLGVVNNYSIPLDKSNFYPPLGANIVPTITQLGFNRSDIKIPGSDIDENIIAEYHSNRNYPAINGTSRLGIHFRHGTISIREAVKKAYALNDTWLQELIWREFYIMILDNFPFVVDTEFNPKYRHFPWRNDESEFKRWCDGDTGFPMVDAGMRELNATGYMHNRCRMITASFLTKHLLIDWRWGEAYFGEKLLDYELASNNGGWQWAAGTGTDAQPYFRIFNPTEQAKKFDPQLEYIKHWIPELNSFNYPNPIIDHKFARQRTLELFKKTANKI